MRKTLILLVLVMINYSYYMNAQSSQEYNSKAIKFAKEGDYNMATFYFKRAIASDSLNASAYANLGNVYRITEKFQLAIESYSHSIRLKDSEIAVIQARANTFMDMNEFQRAIQDYTTIISLHPNFQTTYFDRAYAYIRLKQYDLAKKDLETQLEYKPNHLISKANLANAKTELGLYEEAIIDFKSLLNSDIQDKYILLENVANLYQKLENYEQALEYINKSLKKKKKYNLGYLRRALIYSDLEQKEKACQDLKKAIKLKVQKEKHFQGEEEFKKLLSDCE